MFLSKYARIMKIILASGSPRRYDLLKQMEWDVEVRSLPFAEVETVKEATEQIKNIRNKFLLNVTKQVNAADIIKSDDAVFTKNHPALATVLNNSETQSGVPFSEKDLVLLSPCRNADLVCAYNALGKGKAVANVVGTGIPVVAADTIVVLGTKILGKPADASAARQMLRELSGKSHQVKTATAVFYQDKTLLQVVTTDVHFRRLTEKETDWYVATGEPLDKAGAYGIQGKGAVLVEKIEGSYDNVVGLPLAAVYEMLKKLGTGL